MPIEVPTMVRRMHDTCLKVRPVTLDLKCFALARPLPISNPEKVKYPTVFQSLTGSGKISVQIKHQNTRTKKPVIELNCFPDSEQEPEAIAVSLLASNKMGRHPSPSTPSPFTSVLKAPVIQ